MFVARARCEGFGYEPLASAAPLEEDERVAIVKHMLDPSQGEAGKQVRHRHRHPAVR